MKIRHSSFSARRLLVWSLVLCTLFGCSLKSVTPSEDLPMSEFILGEWKVISRVRTDTEERLEVTFPKVSIYSNELSYGDAYRAEYSFLEEDLIFVDNKRLLGRETWRLEKDNGNLIVYQEFQGFKSTLRLERITR
jgi:hypothetical protein